MAPESRARGTASSSAAALRKMTSRAGFCIPAARDASTSEEASASPKPTRSLPGTFWATSATLRAPPSFYPAGMLESVLCSPAICFRRRFRVPASAPEFFVTSMDITIIAFLGLLLAVAASAKSSSCKFQAPSEANVATAFESRRSKFRWMVLLHTNGSIAPLSKLFFFAVRLFLSCRDFFCPFPRPQTPFAGGSFETLGDHWNVQVMDSTKLGVITTGLFATCGIQTMRRYFWKCSFLPLIPHCVDNGLSRLAGHAIVFRSGSQPKKGSFRTDPRELQQAQDAIVLKASSRH